MKKRTSLLENSSIQTLDIVSKLEIRNSKFLRKASSGQVMLLTTLILSGTILAASTLAGVLIVQQIRQASDSGQSAKALYAADAGIEYELYKIYKKDCSEAEPTLSNGAKIESKTELQSNDDGGQELVISSIGTMNNRARAFSLNLGEVTISTCASSSSTPLVAP